MAMIRLDLLERQAVRRTIEDAREALGLNYAGIASALGVDRRTLLRYRKQKVAPPPHVRERMEQLREITHLLGEVFETGEASPTWLTGPVPLLRGHCPIDLIRRGELSDVLSVLAGLYSGAWT
jgi:uncharacterized protein (DUF2384 family)